MIRKAACLRLILKSCRVKVTSVNSCIFTLSIKRIIDKSMVKRLLVFVGLLSILAALSGPSMPSSPRAHAQGTWTAYLYSYENGRIRLVDQTGAELENIPLPAVMGDTFSQEAAVYDDGLNTFIAYITTGAGGKTLNIYSRVAGGNVVEYVLPSNTIGTSLDILGTTYQFDQTSGNVFALGYILDDFATWSILWANPYTGEVFDPILKSADFYAKATLGPRSSGAAFVPVPQYVVSGSEIVISFTLVAYATGGSSIYDAYQYNTVTGDIFSDPRFVSLDNDLNPADGTVIMPLFDSRLPNSAASFMFGQTNTLQITDFLGYPYPFANDLNYSFYVPNFVQNGTRIFYGVYNADFSIDKFWTVHEANGAFVGQLPGAPLLTSVFGTDVGFIYTSQSEFDPNTYFLQSVSTIPMISPAPAGTEMIPFSLATFAEYTKIVWVSHRHTGAAPKYVALADPVNPLIDPPFAGVSETEATPEPPIAVLPATGLAVGIEVAIFTTDGDTLNMRSGPGRDFRVVTQLANGTRAKILEGPSTSADGLTWWRIDANGFQGWVVEYIDDIQTLNPVVAGSNPTLPPSNPTLPPAQNPTGGNSYLDGYVWHDNCNSKGWNGDFRSVPVGCSTVAPATISGNGILDEGELGIVGVTVELRFGGCTGSPTFVATTVTDGNGYFRFDGLGDGVYCVQVTSGGTGGLYAGQFSFPSWSNVEGLTMTQGATLPDAFWVPLYFGWDYYER